MKTEKADYRTLCSDALNAAAGGKFSVHVDKVARCPELNNDLVMWATAAKDGGALAHLCTAIDPGMFKHPERAAEWAEHTVREVRNLGGLK